MGGPAVLPRFDEYGRAFDSIKGLGRRAIEAYRQGITSGYQAYAPQRPAPITEEPYPSRVPAGPLRTPEQFDIGTEVDATTGFAPRAIQADAESKSPVPAVPVARSTESPDLKAALGIKEEPQVPRRPRAVEGSHIRVGFGGGPLRDYVPGQGDIGAPGGVASQMNDNRHLRNPQAMLAGESINLARGRTRRAIGDLAPAQGELGDMGFSRGEARDVHGPAYLQRQRIEGDRQTEDRRRSAYATLDSKLQARMKALRATPEYAAADPAQRAEAEARIMDAYEQQVATLDRSFGRMSFTSRGSDYR